MSKFTWLEEVEQLVDKNIMSILDNNLKKEIKNWYLLDFYICGDHVIEINIELNNSKIISYILTTLIPKESDRLSYERIIFEGDYFNNKIKAIEERIKLMLKDIKGEKYED